VTLPSTSGELHGQHRKAPAGVWRLRAAQAGVDPKPFLPASHPTHKDCPKHEGLAAGKILQLQETK